VTSSSTWPFDSQVAISYRWSIFTKSLSPMSIKDIGVTTLTFQGHVTSSVTWLLVSGWVVSYWWSFGPNTSNGFRDIPPKHHVLIDTMLNRHCACAISRDMYPCVKFKYIFQFLTRTLPIHYVSFIELRWKIRVFWLFSLWTSNVKGQIERKITLSPTVCKMLTFRGHGDQGAWSVAIFTAKGTSLHESTSCECEPFCVKIG